MGNDDSPPRSLLDGGGDVFNAKVLDDAAQRYAEPFPGTIPRR